MGERRGGPFTHTSPLEKQPAIDGRSSARPDRNAGRALRKLDQNIRPFDLHGEAGNLHRRVLDVGPGGHIVLPAVPGAGHDGAVHIAFSEGAAVMQAGVVERVELPLHVIQGDRVPIRFDDLPLAGREIRDLTDLDLFSHGPPLPCGRETVTSTEKEKRQEFTGASPRGADPTIPSAGIIQVRYNGRPAITGTSQPASASSRSTVNCRFLLTTPPGNCQLRCPAGRGLPSDPTKGAARWGGKQEASHRRPGASEDATDMVCGSTLGAGRGASLCLCLAARRTPHRGNVPFRAEGGGRASVGGSRAPGGAL